MCFLGHALTHHQSLLLDSQKLRDNPEPNLLAEEIKIVHRGYLPVYVENDLGCEFSIRPSAIWDVDHHGMSTILPLEPSQCFTIKTDCGDYQPFFLCHPVHQKNLSTLKIYPFGFQPSKVGISKRWVSASILPPFDFIFMSVSLIVTSRGPPVGLWSSLGSFPELDFTPIDHPENGALRFGTRLLSLFRWGRLCRIFPVL